MNSNFKGNIALGKAISYFTEQEYIVNLPLNDSQCYDLIIEKQGQLQMVQVKYTSHKASSGNYICKLETISGTSREILYTLKETYCDLLFCYTEDNQQYLIPIKDIKNVNSLTLTKDILIKYGINHNINQKIKKVKHSIFSQNNIILQYDLQGNFIQEYATFSDAARGVGKDPQNAGSHISEVCKGKRQTAYGFQWRLKEK